MARHQVKIVELKSVSRAVVNPGILEVCTGDTVEFHNQTAHQTHLLFADRGLFDGNAPPNSNAIKTGMRRAFKVVCTTPGIYEYVVAVTLSDGKGAFAIGASTPRIIIRSSSGVD
jgi:plastocyanin